MSGTSEPIQIAGAGPAGLAAAITLAQAGRKVLVHEMRDRVGYRFHSDLQGLENWTTEQDILEWLKGLGLTTDFEYLPCTGVIVFDDKNKGYEIRDHKPIFYVVERGPGPNSLDSALLAQARKLGVEVHFNSRVDRIEDAGICAIGPRAADAIAVGYQFETNMDNCFWAICNDELAPQGYAYLLVMNGRGTVKSCMFSGFKQEKLYVERTVDAFRRLAGLEMINPKLHGGTGNFRIPDRAVSGKHPIVGEQAGFQDTLWGFGMRIAIASGVLAAHSLLTNKNYDDLWRKEFGSQLKASVVNRALFSSLGNRGYRYFLRFLANKNSLRAILRHHYKYTWVKRLLTPWARYRYVSNRKDISCNHVDCSCVWCRCGRDRANC